LTAKYIPLILILAILIACSSHEELQPPDNPFDPGNPNYISPAAVIVSGPGEGEVVSTTDVDIAWEGNESATEYRYKFDSQDWSDWDEVTSQSFDYLDEGNHSFEVQARSVNGDDQSVSTLLEFTVDAIKDPALFIYPYSQAANQSDTISVSIHVQNTTQFVSAGFNLEYSANSLLFLSSEPGEIIDSWGGGNLQIIDEITDGTQTILTFSIASINTEISNLFDPEEILLLNFIVLSSSEAWVGIGNVNLLNINIDEIEVDLFRGGWVGKN
jgi:hypothetical protein